MPQLFREWWNYRTQLYGRYPIFRPDHGDLEEEKNADLVGGRMYTYQDLAEIGNDEKVRAEFIGKVVTQHKGTVDYHIAVDAEQYFAKKNPTILRYQKMLRNALGQLVPDIWSANYKLTHGFFRQFVLQQTQYVLSNGVTFQEKSTKEKLGKNFDGALQSLAKKAMVDGVSFGFWNLNRLEVFPFVDTKREPGFAPLYDADTGVLRAGIRYWAVGDETKRWTLYEPDGYTEYIQRKGESIEVMEPKRGYIRTIRSSPVGGEEIVAEGIYPGLPIIPMYANDLMESEIIGIRSSIDCYDFISSGMANNIDETSVFYWTLENAGGMDDVDLANFVNRMKELKAVVLDRGVTAEAHTLSVPVEANEALLDRLKNDMYENMMLMNPEKALSGNMTATAIRLAYQQQDDKCGDFEYCIRDFIGKLLNLFGIKDEPSFKWNRIANQTEETQMVMLAALYLDDEAVLKHLPWLTPEEVEEIMKRKAAEDLERLVDNEPDEDVTDDGTA